MIRSLAVFIVVFSSIASAGPAQKQRYRDVISHAAERFQCADTDVDSVGDNITLQGGAQYFATAAATTTMSSSSTNDSSSGTGCQMVKVTGLDSSSALISELKATNGQSNVTLVNSYLWILYAKCKGVGSTGKNDGNIDVKHGASVMARIGSGFGRSLHAVTIIPSNYTGAIVEAWRFTVTGLTPNADIVIGLFWRPTINDAWEVLDVGTVNGKGREIYANAFQTPPRLPSLSHLKMEILEHPGPSVEIFGDFDIEYLKTGTVNASVFDDEIAGVNP